MYILALIVFECIVYFNAKDWQHSLKKSKEDDSDLRN